MEINGQMGLRIAMSIVILCLAVASFAPLAIALINSADDKVEMGKSWEDDYRLPQETQPLHYDLYLHPNLQTNRFTGRVAILIQTTQPRDLLQVHIKYMNITKTEVTNSAGSAVAVANAFEYAPNEFWVVQLGQLQPAGNYTLHLEFNGPLDNGILGFYKSVYVNENGQPRAIATSKFQPTYARRAFPNFDEPSFKSTFTTTLVRSSTDNYIALSNMEIDSEVTDAPSLGLTEVKFHKSVPMVSYLAIFVVCDFLYLETVTPVHKIPFRVYGTSVQKDHLEYSMLVGSNVTDYLATVFDVPYPLPKLDMAAIPDYSSGATEHWGLITYRETNLIFDPLESSTSNQWAVASVVSHELVHQWFGNLVTLFWWNDLWLNEGFATFLSYDAVKSYETSWDTDSMFLFMDLHPVLDLDATLSSHAIVVNVDTPDQINSVFDTISYSKGSSVIRMMRSFMGDREFNLGITNFLRKYSFKNAITQDLFDELAAVSSVGLDITKIMNTWTRQKGYPVLTLTKVGNSYEIRQERFLTDPDAYGKPDEVTPYNYRWEVPVTYIASNVATKTQTWFGSEVQVFTVPKPAGSTWVKFNVDQLGYYRVNYPAEDWTLFSQLLLQNPTALSISDRTSLLNDAFSLAAADRLNYDMALGLTSYLAGERELAPWEATVSKLQYFTDVFYYTDAQPNLQKYLRQLTGDLYTELGWEDTGEFTEKLLRVRILGIACASGISDCLNTAGQKFLAWKDEGAVVAPNLRSLVYGYGVRTEGNQESWDWLLGKYVAEQNAQEKVKLMTGLAAISDPATLYRFIQLAKDINIVRQQDFFSVLNYVSANRVGEPIVWDFVRDEWQYLVDRFTLNDRLMGRMISTITKRFATERRLQEMKDFFAKYPDAGAGEQYRSIALEQVESNIKFVAKYKDVINQWLINNTKSKK